ncbi:MAG: hypothetical protein QOE35_2574 [Actinomycetota bacterium]|jgi:uncharacterized protein YkwD
MRRGAVGLLLGIVVMLAGGQPASAASCFFGCKTTPTTRVATPTPTTAAPKPAPVPAVPAAFDPASATQRLLDLTNGERAAAGVGPLTMRADVAGIAQGQSAAMAAAGTIWHNADFLTQATRNALAARMLGENVGMAGSIDQVHQALMNSPGHRANMLEGAFSIVGMAAVKGPDGLVYITQDFLQPNGGTPHPVAVKKATAPAPAKPKVVAAPKPKVASTPRPTAAPTTAAPTTTEAPTTTVAVQPQSSVLAAVQAAPNPLPTPGPSGPSGTVLVVAFALLAGVSTGAVRVNRRRPQQKVALAEQLIVG